MDFVRRWSEKTGIGGGRFIAWLDVAATKFYDWPERYRKVNEHGWIPRDFWLEDWEKQAIVGFHLRESERDGPLLERDRRQWRYGKRVRLVRGLWGLSSQITPRAYRCACGRWR